MDTFLELSEPLKIYPNISKYIQIYPRYTKIYQDIQSTKRRRGRPARPGPEAAAWYFVYIGISSYILDIFGYIWIYIWYIFGGGGHISVPDP